MDLILLVASLSSKSLMHSEEKRESTRYFYFVHSFALPCHFLSTSLVWLFPSFPFFLSLVFSSDDSWGRSTETWKKHLSDHHGWAKDFWACDHKQRRYERLDERSYFLFSLFFSNFYYYHYYFVIYFSLELTQLSVLPSFLRFIFVK